LVAPTLANALRESTKSVRASEIGKARFWTLSPSIASRRHEKSTDRSPRETFLAADHSARINADFWT